MKKYIMALDQGTTSSRCILFERDGTIAAQSQKEFTQIFPEESWVEQNPLEIWSSQLSVAREALDKVGGDWSAILGIGITNQRETTIVWDRETGMPIYNAIVWQCRRTAGICERIKESGYEKIIKAKTGLLADPYFSATKLVWILENIPCAREKAEAGKLAFGTVDSWLIWNLTGGKRHVTDMTNASRTMLFNIHTLTWDEELLSLFNIPSSIMPEVLPSASLFGYTDENVLGAEIPIGAVAGDQQSALFGQCCFTPGDIKNTYGTGAFLLMNTGKRAVSADNGLLTTVIPSVDGGVCYALEGSVFTCGAAIQWLRDGLKIIESASESEAYAAAVEDSGGVVVVPAFTGLGAPYWDPFSRGAVLGITRATTKNHLIRATLESLAFQTADVVRLMEDTSKISINELRVDGGASANNLLMQIQSDLLQIDILRPSCIESTALGAAFLCGLTLGVYKDAEDILSVKHGARRFTPKLDADAASDKLRLWHKAVERTLGWIE